MFERLLHIHQVMSGESKDDPVSLLKQSLPEAYQYGIAICFDPSGNYRGVQLTKGNTDVVYAKGLSHQGAYDPTAVSLLGPKGAVNAAKRLGRAIEGLALSPACSDLRFDLEAIANNYDIEKISAHLEDKLKQKNDDKERAFVYVAWEEGDRIVPLYSYPEVQYHIVETQLSRFATREGVSLIAQDRPCAVCGRIGRQVMGNFTLITCYNLDKPGAIAGGMDYSAATSNFPVCDKCILGVSDGWNFAQTHLIFRLAGEQYLLLPQVYDPQIRESVIELLRDREKGASLRKDALKTITYDEEEIMEDLAERSGDRDTITLSMVFFKKENAAWRITGEIHEILPSRIRQIYLTKRAVERDPVLTFKEDKTYHFTLEALNTFSGSRPDKQSRKQFLSYVDAIFSGGQVAREVFFRDAVSTILNGFKREPGLASFMVRDAWASYGFLRQLGVLPSPKGGVQMTQEDNAYGRFMAEHQDFFDRPEKKVAFLTGCYVEIVCYVQRKPEHLGNDPFFRKVRGLKMDQRRLQKIHREARDKLHQYDSLGLVVTTLDPQLAQAWIDCGNQWELSDDETSFAFTLGLSLIWKVRGAKDSDASTDADVEDQAA